MRKCRQQLRDDFAPLVARAARQWRRAVDRRLQPFGLTEATWLPLIYLARASAPMRQKDLAAALTLDGSSVVRLLDALEASELVERRGEDGDRRARIIVPTRRGLSIVAQVGAFQMMLDRGETLDWFSSREIILEACIAGLCFYICNYPGHRLK